MGSEAGIVCVTGASGFVGSWLVMRLLERGYTVRATMRDPENVKKVKHLLELPKAKTHLTLWKADLADEGSYNEAIKGCTGVFHVATPMDFESKDPENEVIKATVAGMLDIMKACLAAKNEVIKPTVAGMLDIMKACLEAKVKRLVFTSSAGTVNVEPQQKSTYDESNWSDINFCRTIEMTGWMYFVSKTCAEQAAWKFAKEHNMDFITIVPTLVIGSFISPTMPPSLITGLAPITGNEAHYFILKQGQYIHLEDLCEAHIFLYEHPKAEGRYIASSHSATIYELVKMLREKYPEYTNIPTKFKGYEENIENVYFSSKKLNDLGFQYKYSFEDMFAGAIEKCREMGFIPFAHETKLHDKPNGVAQNEKNNISVVVQSICP